MTRCNVCEAQIALYVRYIRAAIIIIMNILFSRDMKRL